MSSWGWWQPDWKQRGHSPAAHLALLYSLSAWRSPSQKHAVGSQENLDGSMWRKKHKSSNAEKAASLLKISITIISEGYKDSKPKFPPIKCNKGKHFIKLTFYLAKNCLFSRIFSLSALTATGFHFRVTQQQDGIMTHGEQQGCVVIRILGLPPGCLPRQSGASTSALPHVWFKFAPQHLHLHSCSQIVKTNNLFNKHLLSNYYMPVCWTLHNLTKNISLPPPFYRWGNWGKERLSNLFKMTQLKVRELEFKYMKSGSTVYFFNHLLYYAASC